MTRHCFSTGSGRIEVYENNRPVTRSDSGHTLATAASISQTRAIIVKSPLVTPSLLQRLVSNSRFCFASIQRLHLFVMQHHSHSLSTNREKNFSSPDDRIGRPICPVDTWWRLDVMKWGAHHGWKPALIYSRALMVTSVATCIRFWLVSAIYCSLESYLQRHIEGQR